MKASSTNIQAPEKPQQASAKFLVIGLLASENGSRPSALVALVSCAILLLALPCGAASDENATPPAITLESSPAETRETPNRFGIAWRMTFNVQVGFKNIGAFAARTDPGPATGGNMDRTYDDGFNRVDVTGNNHGSGYGNTTWYWGYDSESQVLPGTSNPQSVVMHSSSSSGTALNDREDDRQPGVEFSYNRELLRCEHWRLGLEGVFGYTELTVEDNAVTTTDVSQINDSYSVPTSGSGQYLPPPGRNATYNGPGSVISSSPTRTTSTTQGRVTGSRSFRADLFSFRLGPYFELPFGKHGAFDLSGGLALMYVESKFGYAESTAVTGLSSYDSAASGWREQLRAGGYAAGTFSYAINDHWSAFAGAQFQDLGKYTHTEGSRTATLDLSRAIFVSLGLSYSF
jgi:hypothetical protein